MPDLAFLFMHGLLDGYHVSRTLLWANIRPAAFGLFEQNGPPFGDEPPIISGLAIPCVYVAGDESPCIGMVLNQDENGAFHYDETLTWPAPCTPAAAFSMPRFDPDTGVLTVPVLDVRRKAFLGKNRRVHRPGLGAIPRAIDEEAAPMDVAASPGRKAVDASQTTAIGRPPARTRAGKAYHTPDGVSKETRMFEKGMNSPLCYAGGKSRMAKTIVDIIPEHHTYCEVFAGAAWVFFKKPESRVEVINDLDSDLICFYRCCNTIWKSFYANSSGY